MGQETAFTYRRAYERFALGSQAEVNTEKAHGIISIVSDLSSRGAGIITTVPFDPGEQVSVMLKTCFLFREAVRRNAKIVWCKKLDYNLWQAGIDFGANNLVELA